MTLFSRIIPFWVDHSLADKRASGHTSPEPAGGRRGGVK